MEKEITFNDVDSLVAEYLEKEKERDALSEMLAEKNKALYALSLRIANFLKELKRDKYESPFGKVEVREKWRVNLPADDMAKLKLFEHLRERGIFEKYATVNSNSLNALYMRDWEEAKERGEGFTFSMPGIEAPKLTEVTYIKPKKEK